MNKYRAKIQSVDGLNIRNVACILVPVVAAFAVAGATADANAASLDSVARSHHRTVSGDEAALQRPRNRVSRVSSRPAEPEQRKHWCCLPFAVNEKMQSKPLATIVAPSLLSCDFGNLGAEAKRVLDAGADWLHVDVMDGHFVDNLTLGPVVFQGLRRAVGQQVFLDCHFMTTAPVFWIEQFARVNGDNQGPAPNLGCTFHYEVFGEDGLRMALALCERVRALRARPAVALRPSTPVEAVLPLVDAAAVDMVLIMTVEPGHGGQSFMPECLPKVRFLRERYPLLDIQADGGIGLTTADAAAQAGCNVLVSGSAVFGAGPNAGRVIAGLREALRRAHDHSV